MFTQIRYDRDTLSLRGVEAATRFMAEVDHKGQFMAGFSEALAQRLLALRDESHERYDVARVCEIFARRCRSGGFKVVQCLTKHLLILYLILFK